MHTATEGLARTLRAFLVFSPMAKYRRPSMYAYCTAVTCGLPAEEAVARVQNERRAMMRFTSSGVMDSSSMRLTLLIVCGLRLTDNQRLSRGPRRDGDHARRVAHPMDSQFTAHR